MSHTHPAFEEATQVAESFNARHGVTLLRAVATQSPVFKPEHFAALERDLVGRWFTVRALFEHIHPRTAAHGELVNLGRQLRKRYTREVRGRNVAFYLIAAPTPESL